MRHLLLLLVAVLVVAQAMVLRRTTTKTRDAYIPLASFNLGPHGAFVYSIDLDVNATVQLYLCPDSLFYQVRNFHPRTTNPQVEYSIQNEYMCRYIDDLSDCYYKSDLQAGHWTGYSANPPFESDTTVAFILNCGAQTIDNLDSNMLFFNQHGGTSLLQHK